MGRPTNETSPSQRFSPYKRRSPLGVLSRKFTSMVSSAVAIGSGLRRSFTKVILHNKIDKPNFSSLPLEILFQLFDLSSAETLVQLSVLSHSHINRVFSYLDSNHFTTRIQKMLSHSLTKSSQNTSLPDLQGSNGLDDYAFSPIAFAQLIRNCHLFWADTEENESLCSRFIVQLYIKTGSQNNANHNVDYWGKLISNISRDWSQTDFYTFMKMFADVTGLRARIDRFMYRDGEPDKVEELALRRLLRPLFLNNTNSPATNFNSAFGGRAQELHFRLAALLHLFASEESLAHRLILLLGAPINMNDGQPMLPIAENPLPSEFVDYHRIFAEPIHDHESAKTFFGDLPMLLEQLLLTKTIDIEELHWTELEVFNFMEMLTTYPEPWVLRNFASLLITSSGLARVAVYIRALHGDPAEAGNTLFSCVEASLFLGVNPNIILRDTMCALYNKCSFSTRLTVLREAISTTNHLTMEALGNSNVPIVNADDVDLVNLKNALEANRQVAELFIAHFNLIIV